MAKGRERIIFLCAAAVDERRSASDFIARARRIALRHSDQIVSNMAERFFPIFSS
jgi:hypothetical protein